MGIAAIIFTFMAIPYKYIETEEEKKAREAEEGKKAHAEKPKTEPTFNSSGYSPSSIDGTEEKNEESTAPLTAL